METASDKCKLFDKVSTPYEYIVTVYIEAFLKNMWDSYCNTFWVSYSKEHLLLQNTIAN